MAFSVQSETQHAIVDAIQPAAPEAVGPSPKKDWTAIHTDLARRFIPEERGSTPPGGTLVVQSPGGERRELDFGTLIGSHQTDVDKGNAVADRIRSALARGVSMADGADFQQVADATIALLSEDRYANAASGQAEEAFGEKVKLLGAGTGITVEGNGHVSLQTDATWSVIDNAAAKDEGHEEAANGNVHSDELRCRAFTQVWSESGEAKYHVTADAKTTGNADEAFGSQKASFIESTVHAMSVIAEAFCSHGHPDLPAQSVELRSQPDSHVPEALAQLPCLASLPDATSQRLELAPLVSNAELFSSENRNPSPADDEAPAVQNTGASFSSAKKTVPRDEATRVAARKTAQQSIESKLANVPPGNRHFRLDIDKTLLYKETEFKKRPRNAADFVEAHVENATYGNAKVYISRSVVEFLREQQEAGAKVSVSSTCGWDEESTKACLKELGLDIAEFDNYKAANKSTTFTLGFAQKRHALRNVDADGRHNIMIDDQLQQRMGFTHSIDPAIFGMG